MAQPPRQPGAEGAAFVRDIVSDPNNVPDVMLLYGYLGASSEEGHERLYLGADLTNYVEVPANAVLHRMAAPKEQDPHGGTTLWVKKDAKLIYKMAPAAQALANYFAGAIQAQAQAGPAAPLPTPPLTIGGCTVQPAACPPVTVVGPACTQANTCGIDCSVVCPTRPPHATCGIDCSVVCPTRPPHGTCGQPCQSFATPCPTHPVQCTHVAPCPTHVATCPPHVSCGVDCTVIGPLCQTHHATCAPVCTRITPCQPTHGQPQCPFPTEVTCAPVCQASPAPFCGPPHVTAAACSVGCLPGGGQEQVAQMAARCFAGTAAPVNTLWCSLVCHTQVVVQCGTFHTPCCPVQTLRGASCAVICGSFHTPCCPVTLEPGCPRPTWACPESLACPSLPCPSFACGPGGPGGPGPVEQAAGQWGGWASMWCSNMCTGNFCHTPRHPCTPFCPQ